MKRNVCLKSALRQPAHTLVLVLLVGLITFAFVSRVVEYLVVNRETDRLARYYHSIGTLHRIAPVPDDWGIDRGAELVSGSQYVAFEDLRRHCSGVLQGIYNSDVDGGHWYFDLLTYDVLFYGKLLSKAHLPGTIEEYRFSFEADNVVAGFPEYVREGSEVDLKYFPKYVFDPAVEPFSLKYIPENPDEMDAPYQSLEVGERYLIRARCDPFYRAFYMNEKGDSAGDFLTIEPLQSGFWFHEVEPGAFVDLADPTWARLVEELAVMEENLHAMWVTSTSDMSSMPDTQEASRYLYLTKGRWLDSEDNLEGRRVCVVHNDFAVRRGVSVGDTITLKLRDLKNQSYGGYIFAPEDWGAWQCYETHTEELEIVGLYGWLSSYPSQATIVSTFAYIPDSCMPAGYYSREGIFERDYSFVLDSPEHEDDFLAETRQALEGLGIQVSFVESGWNNFQAAAVPLKQSLAINVRVFSAVLVPAMALAAFLYLWQRRRDFATLRSMGVPKGSAIRQLVWSMAAIGTTSVTAGGLLSWGYTLRKAARTLAFVQGSKGADPSAHLSLAWLVGLCAVAIVVLFSFTALGASAMSRRPVLELLQGTESRAVRKRKPVAGAEGGRNLERAPATLPYTSRGAPEGGIARSLGEARATRDPRRALSSGYVLSHSLRAPLKSILTIAVATGFTLALGWLNWSMERNNAKLDELYRSTQVEAEIVRVNPSLGTASGFIPSGEVYSVLQTGFIKDAYLVAAANASLVGTFVGGEESGRDYKGAAERVPLLSFTQPEWFFSERTGNVAVEYAEGCDESLLSKEWTDRAGGHLPVVLPVAMISQLRLQLGDSVWIQHNTSFTSIDCKVVGQYTGTVISGGSKTPILLPLSVLKILVASDLRYSVARFAVDPERNRELPEFRAEMDALFGDDGKSGAARLTLIFWDNQMTQVVEPMERNLLLIKILHSVTMTVSALIAAGLGALMVLQSAKEAAIMRVLGVTKRLARSMLCWEQALLCLLGLALGLGSLAVLRSQVSAAFTAPTLGCAVLYLAGCLIGAWQGARSVTDRAPLELLQVKE